MTLMIDVEQAIVEYRWKCCARATQHDGTGRKLCLNFGLRPRTAGDNGYEPDENRDDWKRSALFCGHAKSSSSIPKVLKSFKSSFPRIARADVTRTCVS